MQGFIHFSYEASEHRLVIGGLRHIAGSLYTDPRIHTSDAVGFGPGNLGLDGMDDFLCNHRCGQLCEELGLPRPKRPDAARTSQRRQSAGASRRHFGYPDQDNFASSSDSVDVAPSWTSPQVNGTGAS
jgi:hypothetical protein